MSDDKNNSDISISNIKYFDSFEEHIKLAKYLRNRWKIVPILLKNGKPLSKNWRESDLFTLYEEIIHKENTEENDDEFSNSSNDNENEYSIGIVTGEKGKLSVLGFNKDAKDKLPNNTGPWIYMEKEKFPILILFSYSRFLTSKLTNNTTQIYNEDIIPFSGKVKIYDEGDYLPSISPEFIKPVIDMIKSKPMFKKNENQKQEVIIKEIEKLYELIKKEANEKENKIKPTTLPILIEQLQGKEFDNKDEPLEMLKKSIAYIFIVGRGYYLTYRESEFGDGVLIYEKTNKEDFLKDIKQYKISIRDERNIKRTLDNGKNRCLRFRRDGEQCPYKAVKGIEICKHCKKVQNKNETNIYTVISLKDFINKYESIFTYHGLGFLPLKPDTRLSIIPGTRLYNGFRGWRSILFRNDELVQRIKKYIKEILANDDKKSYKYIIRWLASLVQFPEIKQGVVLVFIGEQGTGKSSFWKFIVRKLIGIHAIITGRTDALLGKFNSLAKNMILAVCEEFESGKDTTLKQFDSQIKDLITSDVRTIEQKGKDQYEVRDYCRYVLLSNKFKQPLLSDDARRYAAFEVNNKKKNDYNYFGKIDREIFNNQDAANAFLYYLLNKDIKGSNDRDFPSTEFREKIVKSNQISTDRFLSIYDWGIISNDGDGYESGKILNKNNMVSIRKVYLYYKTWCNSCNEKPISFKDFPLFIHGKVKYLEEKNKIFIGPILGKENFTDKSGPIEIDEIDWISKDDIEKLPKL